MLSLMFLVYSTKHSAHSENSDQRMRQVVAYKQWKNINRQTQKVVAVAYRRWSFTRGSNCKALTAWESFGVLDWRSLMGGGRLREVVAHGGSTESSHSDWLFNLVLKSIVTVGNFR